MTHTAHGRIVGLEQGDGLVDPTGMVLLAEMNTVAIQGKRVREDGGVETDPPSVALELAGRVNRSADTVSAVFWISLEDAGQLAGHLAHAVARAGGPEALQAFMDGFSVGLS